MKTDSFTIKRISRFVTEFRNKKGILPLLKDFKEAGFEDILIKKLIKDDILTEWYVTLTNGSIVKGYKVKDL